jgi:hypothetical protein
MFKKALNKKMSKSDYTMKEYWFSKIKSKELVVKLIKDGSIVFCIIAGISIVWTYFFPSQYIEETFARLAIGILYAVMAGILFKWKSRVAAVLLLLLTSDALITTFSNRFGNGDGGRNVILAMLILWLAIRVVQATFKLHSKNKLPESSIMKSTDETHPK